MRLGAGSRHRSQLSGELPAAELNSPWSQETLDLVGSGACPATIFPPWPQFTSSLQ